MIGRVLSERSYKSKSHDDPENGWSCSISKCGKISKPRSILFGDQAFQLSFLSVHIRDDPVNVKVGFCRVLFSDSS